MHRECFIRIASYEVYVCAVMNGENDAHREILFDRKVRSSACNCVVSATVAYEHSGRTI